MRTHPIALLMAVTTILAGVAPSLGATVAPYPPHTVANSQLRVLPPTEDGRHYQLHIGLPGGYEKEPGRRYPVVYVTDGY